MEKGVASLAIFGGKPAFETPLYPGQVNLPDWGDFERAFRGIFNRRYYTNHGTLAQELEDRLCDFFGVRHVVCMTNATICLKIASKALSLRGKVIVPAFTSPATFQSLTWGGLEPVFCDVDPMSHLITPELTAPLIDDFVSAILGVHLWGKICETERMEHLAHEAGIKVYYDAAHAFGCSENNIPVGRFGEVAIFSFQESNILNALEGGCACTNDDSLAARLRNIRSSYGAGDPVPVPVTGNGRMSEAQAAMALLSLSEYSANKRKNKERFEKYTALLGPVPGIRFLYPNPGVQSNYQSVVAEVDEHEFGLNRDDLIRILLAENIYCQAGFGPEPVHGASNSMTYPVNNEKLPNTAALYTSVMLFPSGQLVTLADIQKVADVMLNIFENAKHIREMVQGAT